ncbi:hypothetical protein B0H11DRAFT_2295417 [Mycena galericulata]|nr:hypothetical protein B0H11DRAFT_2295417 [Mycena galericulata]
MAMDGSGFPPCFWESSGSERQQRTPPLVSSAPAAGGMAPFTFPANYGLSSTTSMDPTDFFTHPAPPLPPAFSQPWLDLLPLVRVKEMSLVTAMSSIFSWQTLASDGYSTSIFSSAPPSSIPEDDDWSSRWSSSGSRPVSAAPSSDYGDPTRHPYLLKSDSGMAQIGPLLTCRVFLTHVLNLADTVNFSCVEADLHLADEATDMVARLGWDFKPSNDRWLDPDVSSEVAEFPQGIRLTGKNKIYAFHRVTGCPSQFPIFRQRTGYLINLTDMKDMNPDPDVTVDQLIRDQDSHSWGRGTGARSKVDAYVPGSFFGLSGDVKIACRRAAPECGGVTACESLDPVFLKGEWRELNPEEIRILAAATLRTREMQDNTEISPPRVVLLVCHAFHLFQQTSEEA